MKMLFFSKVSLDGIPYGLWEGYIRNHRYDALAVSIRDWIKNFGEEGIVDAVTTLVRGYHPDYVFIPNPIVELLPCETWEKIRHNCKLIKSKWIFWSMDDPFKIEVIGEKQGKRAAIFDLVATCDGSEETKKFYLDHGAQKVIYLVPPAPHFLLDRAKVMFIRGQIQKNERRIIMFGSNTYEKVPYAAEGTLSRYELVREIGKKVEVYGTESFVEKFEDLENADCKSYAPYKTLDDFAGTVILNPHVRIAGRYLNGRFYEACALGALQIVERKEIVEELASALPTDMNEAFLSITFKPGDMKSACEAVDRAFNMPWDKAKLVVAASLEIASKFTSKHFFDQAFKAANNCGRLYAH